MTSQVLSKIGLVGYTGKLGNEVLKQADQNQLDVVLKANRAGWREEATPQVVINISHRSAVSDAVIYCLDKKLPYIEGTSGLEKKDLDLLKEASEQIPVIRAENFSFGNFIQLNLLVRLTELLKHYNGNKELSIIDRHTTRKKDKPSATALLLQKVWEQHSGQTIADLTAVRAGLPVSDHTAWLTLTGEELKIIHNVTDREAAAKGAIIASNWILSKDPSYNTMSDVYHSM